MSDKYLKFSQHPITKRIVTTLNLPLPAPPEIARSSQPWPAQFLQGDLVAYAAGGSGELAKSALSVAHSTGAELVVHSEASAAKAVSAAEKALGISTGTVPGADGPKIKALIFDASGLDDAMSLSALHAFFHPLIRRLSSNGRVIVLGRPVAETDDPEAAAARRGLEGFVRSVAKEIGKKAATAQVLYVRKGAEGNLAGPLRYFLSPYSAFVTGQPVIVGKEAGAAESLWAQPLKGKTALVTGAARGIGAAIARTLAREGARVVCLDMPGDDALQKVARELGGDSIACDVTDEKAPTMIARHLKEKHGGVDIVVHNAGVTRDKTLGRMDARLWDMVLNINLASIARINRELLDTDVVRKNGRIVCVSSISGIAGNVGQTNYSASKAGVIGYVQSLCKQTAGEGITVNAVAPGFIETQMTAAIPLTIREVGRRLNAFSQGGLPEDVADVITFLSSPGAAGLNGQVIRVCGQNLVGA